MGKSPVKRISLGELVNINRESTKNDLKTIENDYKHD